MQICNQEVLELRTPYCKFDNKNCYAAFRHNTRHVNKDFLVTVTDGVKSKSTVFNHYLSSQVGRFG